MGMWDPGDPAGFEHAGAGHDLDKAPIRIADAHEAAAALPNAANEASQQNRRHRGREKPGKDIGNLVESARGIRRRQSHLREGLGGPAGIRGQCCDLAAGLDEAEQGQHGDENGDG
jgi:hypothetical protein